MFKRLFWLTMGAGFGFGVSFWLMRWVRETTEKAAARLTPERVAQDLKVAARRAASSAVARARPGTHHLALRANSLLRPPLMAASPPGRSGPSTRIAPLAPPTPLSGDPGPGHGTEQPARAR